MATPRALPSHEHFAGIHMISKVHISNIQHFPNSGDYNDLPPNWKELTEKEFAQSPFFTYSPEFMEFRQVRLTPNGPFEGLRMFWLNEKEGYALVRDYWAGKVRYFSFAVCVHEWHGVTRAELAEKWPQHVKRYTPGNCCHNSVCLKCGDFRFIDSSD